MLHKLQLRSLLSVTVGILTLNIHFHCFAQCGTSGPAFTDTPPAGCILEAYGGSGTVLKAETGQLPGTFNFYVRLTAGGTGKLVTPLERVVWVGVELDGGTGYRGPFAAEHDPWPACVTVFGSCIGFFPNIPNGTNMTIAPWVSTRTTPIGSGNKFASNIGPSVSIVLHSDSVKDVDVGTLGPSTCDIRPSTEVGEPINIGSGNVYRNEVDAVINSGKIGAFSFERNYNSLNGQLSSFGYGWQ
ncbi:MAG: DUF6531 domain-containing protein, partial [candidate division Zixibacteria bacterium]|nr:DUF6531 domain-containing protein [candidate division Zixibacteria bacterium]